MKIKELLTKENVGGYDLFIRAVLGVLALISIALGLVASPWNLILALVAFIGIWSSITRHCTPYVILGISTVEKK